jgi:hypothetical protein
MLSWKKTTLIFLFASIVFENVICPPHGYFFNIEDLRGYPEFSKEGSLFDEIKVISPFLFGTANETNNGKLLSTSCRGFELSIYSNRCEICDTTESSRIIGRRRRFRLGNTESEVFDVAFKKHAGLLKMVFSVKDQNEPVFSCGMTFNGESSNSNSSFFVKAFILYLTKKTCERLFLREQEGDLGALYYADKNRYEQELKSASKKILQSFGCDKSSGKCIAFYATDA